MAQIKNFNEFVEEMSIVGNQVRSEFGDVEINPEIAIPIKTGLTNAVRKAMTIIMTTGLNGAEPIADQREALLMAKEYVGQTVNAMIFSSVGFNFKTSGTIPAALQRLGARKMI